MPSKSESQRGLMEACSTDKGRARVAARGKVKCPPKAVAQEFRAADRAKLRAAKASKKRAAKRAARGQRRTR